ncbi:TetR/AcrR family transcriptional regulator [Leifsonia sp. NPDC058292]|uniref:TetR/AcrR family transcriptional regulator n=1 Tax=Leifsonia sp. NPDC058292 TaxID=3346428 RepID=UPI0036DDEDAA
MALDAARERAMQETRTRILDVARDLLGQHPNSGMGEIARAAGVVRRTVYGYFPARGDLVRALATQAAGEISAVLTDVDRPGLSADEAWARFVRELWPLAHRYRVLLALRRGDHGDEIHAVLRSVDAKLATLIQRGQNDGVIGTHLPPDVLARLSYATVFAIADDRRGDPTLDARAATITSLLMLGVTAERAHEILRRASL